jgi:hypothetical protein
VASLTTEERAAIREAVEKMRKDEPYERSLGRSLRGHGFTYDDYVRVIGEIREIAKARKIAVVDAALAAAEGPE